MRASILIRSVLFAVASLVMAVPVLAAVPLIVPVQAALTTSAGGGAPDGIYQVTFTLLDGAAGKILWTEGPTALTAKGGIVGWALGSKTPLTQSLLNGERWLQLQIGIDPAVPAVQLQATPYAIRAALAEELDCSGCVKAGHLDPAALQAYAKTADLGGFAKATDLSEYVKAASLAKVAGTGSFTDLLDKPKLADVATTGSYGDLTNTPVMAQLGKACGTGLVMRGIKADGSYDCVTGSTDAASLPKDGLDEVSNGLLTNQFMEVAPSLKTPMDIPDGLAAGAIDALDVPDFGIATNLTVTIDVANSDMSKVRITLYDPTGVAYKLYDQNGTGKTLTATYPTPTKMVLGDFSAWVGKNPKGTWSTNVADLANGGAKYDGKLNSWSMQVYTLSSKKVAASGAILLANLSKEPFPCTPTVFGAQWASSADKAVYICNGSAWFPILLTALGTKEAPAINCKDLLAKAPISKSGAYWVDPDGPGNDAPYQVYCDMTNDGGGWTLVWSNLRGGAGKPMTNMTWTTATNTTPLYFKGPVSDNLEAFGVFVGLKRWMQLGPTELRYTWSTDFGQPLQQSWKATYSLNGGANYTISMANPVQIIGSVAPGLFSSHNNQPFSTVDADHDSYGPNCAALYSGTPWWYTSCWSGNINGGGENNGDGHYNGAYWTGSQQAWAGAGGQGAGNGWVFVR